MLYVVDGHNLIGKVPGLSLAMLDDEDRLLELLRPFVLAKKGRKVEVFFDKAPPGRAGVRSYGSITAHYVPESSTADDAIAVFLQKMGRAARNGVYVVSSDHKVQNSARSVHAEVMLSEAFAEELLQAKAKRGGGETSSPTSQSSSRSAARSALTEGGLSEREVTAWLTEFRVDPSEADRPIETLPSQKTSKKAGGSAKQRAPKPRPHHGFPKKGS